MIKLTILAAGLACFPQMDSIDKVLNGEDLNPKAPYTLAGDYEHTYELPEYGYDDLRRPNAVVWGT